MPVGLHLVGDYFDEARMLDIAHRFQQATDWHLRKPPVEALIASAYKSGSVGWVERSDTHQATAEKTTS